MAWRRAIGRSRGDGSSGAKVESASTWSSIWKGLGTSLSSGARTTDNLIPPATLVEPFDLENAALELEMMEVRPGESLSAPHVLTTDPSDAGNPSNAGSAGIFSRRTNRTLRVWHKSRRPLDREPSSVTGDSGETSGDARPAEGAPVTRARPNGRTSLVRLFVCSFVRGRFARRYRVAG
eukprot:910745-Prorocentrum_minimum.AAC.1